MNTFKIFIKDSTSKLAEAEADRRYLQKLETELFLTTINGLKLISSNLDVAGVLELPLQISSYFSYKTLISSILISVRIFKIPNENTT